MKYNIILRNGRYALLEMETQYIVACGFDETQSEGSQWTQGYYYTHWNTSEIVKQRMLSAALEYYRALTETDYIPRCRLEELATQFKDGLIEDDEESAMEYFDEVCEMTESEWHARKLVENYSTWKDGKARIVSCIMEEKEYYN